MKVTTKILLGATAVLATAAAVAAFAFEDDSTETGDVIKDTIDDISSTDTTETTAE